MMSDEAKVLNAVAATRARHSGPPLIHHSSGKPILENITVTPNAARYAKYRWCDYIELRCLTHADRRFSQDGLSEAMDESRETSVADFDETPPPDEFETETEDVDDGDMDAKVEQDKDEGFSAAYFKQLRWRAGVFGVAWPFTIDEHAHEIRLRSNLDATHKLYLQLLLSSLLKYCPASRRKAYTSSFEALSGKVFKGLMPQGAQVHAFGAASSPRYTGPLFTRLEKLARDVRGVLLLTQQDFPKNDVGDGGLDLVAWHDLKDERDHIPIALAQCGCTAEGWPNKMLEASPAKLGKKLVTGHDWATYYFMPLDLTDERDGTMHWQESRDISHAIVIDRLRLIRLADMAELDWDDLTTKAEVDEALSFRLT